MLSFPNYHDTVPSLGHRNRAWRQRVVARYRRDPVPLPVPVADRFWPWFSPRSPAPCGGR